MESVSAEKNLLKKIKVLTHVVIISGSLNIGFLFSLSVIALKNFQKKNHYTSSNQQVKGSLFISLDSMDLLSEYFNYSYEKLLNELYDPTLVEDGYCKRDFALACLVSFHYFDIDKALSGLQLTRRVIEFIHEEGGERAKIEIFPGLCDPHFEALISFAKREKWPFNSQGLFHHLKRGKEIKKIPSSLIQTFYKTREFEVFWREISLWKKEISSEKILFMMIDADWDYIEKIHLEMDRKKQAGSDLARSIVLDLLKFKSIGAAKVALEYDREFFVSKSDDESILFLLSQLKKGDYYSEAFARGLLMSLRGDEVRIAAGKKLYELYDELAPTPYRHQTTLLRFLPHLFNSAELTKTKESKQDCLAPLKIQKRFHKVAKGETLWKISSHYKISVKRIVETNKLSEKALLKPGMTLEIPSH